MIGVISLEWLTPHHAILRHHPDGGGFGADFDLVCVLALDGARVTIKGLLCRGHYTTAMRRAIAIAIQALGMRFAEYERKNGRPRKFSLRVPVPA